MTTLFITGITCLIVGIVTGFCLACRAFSAMQEDFVNVFSKPPKE
jgi:MFS superfamily sulfate permease-like transporter